jgi:uncharacterized protein (DUF3084 family)
MGQPSAVRSRIVLRAIVALSVFAAAGSAAGIGSAHGAKEARAFGCQPKPGAVVRTLWIGDAHAQTVRANVGDTIKVIARLKGATEEAAPEPSDHRRAVCRISHRSSASGWIAKFRAERAPKERVTFVARGWAANKGCPPRSHGCFHVVKRIGYVRIKLLAGSFTG